MAIGVNERSERPAAHRAIPMEHQLRLLLRYAILAPSTRNSQPWRFTVERNVVGLWGDQGQHLPAASPNGREIYLSLGCALENLVVAAECAGYRHEIVYFPDRAAPDLVARISFHLEPSAVAGGPTAAALENLELPRTALRPFLAREIATSALDRLRAVRSEPGVRVCLSDGAERRRHADVLSVRAVATLFGDGGSRQEMLEISPWPAQIGKVTPAHGNPARRLGQQVSALIRSAPVLGVIGSTTDTPVDQVRSGRMLERLWLAATAEGLALQPISFALQAPSTRDALAALFPEAGSYAQQLLRLGYAADRDGADTTRRPLEDVISDGRNGRATSPD